MRPAGLPQDRGRAGHLRPVAGRPARPRASRGGPRRAAQQPDGGLAMHLGDGHDLVQEPVLLRSTGVLIPLPLPAAYSRRLARVTVPSWGDW